MGTRKYRPRTSLVFVNTPAVIAASAVIRDEHDRVLLIKRGHQPGMGLWSLPGGALKPGETLAEAAKREAWEETGLVVDIGHHLWSITVELGRGHHYDVHGFVAEVVGGQLRAGDDAAEVLWCDAEHFVNLQTTPRLAELLARAGWPASS
jgi:8-oxo-dGTP diphosphatase